MFEQIFRGVSGRTKNAQHVTSKTERNLRDISFPMKNNRNKKTNQERSFHRNLVELFYHLFSFSLLPSSFSFLFAPPLSRTLLLLLFSRIERPNSLSRCPFPRIYRNDFVLFPALRSLRNVVQSLEPLSALPVHGSHPRYFLFHPRYQHRHYQWRHLEATPPLRYGNPVEESSSMTGLSWSPWLLADYLLFCSHIQNLDPLDILNSSLLRILLMDPIFVL